MNADVICGFSKIQIQKLSSNMSAVSGEAMILRCKSIRPLTDAAPRCNVSQNVDTISIAVKEQHAKHSAPAGVCKFPRNPLGIQ